MAEEDVKTLNACNLTFYVREPKKEATKTFFFFSLSAHDSLFLPPFCHPVDSLLKNGCRVISTTLPNHKGNQRPYGIQEIWKDNKEEVLSFLDDLNAGVNQLAEIFSPPFGALGISRGAFTSLHLASRNDHIDLVVGYAPMLSAQGEMEITPLIPNLKHKSIHFFVGHNDILIGTDNVIELQKKILEENKDAKIYTKISPSIGRGGHGTTDPIFLEGTKWAINNLKTS